MLALQKSPSRSWFRMNLSFGKKPGLRFPAPEEFLIGEVGQQGNPLTGFSLPPWRRAEPTALAHHTPRTLVHSMQSGHGHVPRSFLDLHIK